jgi:hypothetical protein
LYAQKFSDLVDVPEDGCHPLESVEKPSAALQSGVQQAVGTSTSAGKFGSAPAPCNKKACNPGGYNHWLSSEILHHILRAIMVQFCEDF